MRNYLPKVFLLGLSFLLNVGADLYFHAPVFAQEHRPFEDQVLTVKEDGSLLWQKDGVRHYLKYFSEGKHFEYQASRLKVFPAGRRVVEDYADLNEWKVFHDEIQRVFVSRPGGQEAFKHLNIRATEIPRNAKPKLQSDDLRKAIDWKDIDGADITYDFKHSSFELRSRTKEGPVWSRTVEADRKTRFILAVTDAAKKDERLRKFLVAYPHFAVLKSTTPNAKSNLPVAASAKKPGVN